MAILKDELPGMDPTTADVVAEVLRGKTFHRVSALEKLMPGEKDQCDWKTVYFLEEDGETYVR